MCLGIAKGRHSIEVAFAPLTQQSSYGILAFSKSFVGVENTTALHGVGLFLNRTKLGIVHTLFSSFQFPIIY